MINEKFNEKFDFSTKVQRNIQRAFKKFIKESKKIGEDFDISEEKKKFAIQLFVNNMLERILDKNEGEQNIKFSEEERNYFKEKIIGIIS